MSNRYQLEKYRGKSTRHTCPNCGHKWEFTRYIDTETGEYLATDVGICNRADKCGYHYTPSQYFRDHPERRAEYRSDDTECHRKNAEKSDTIKKGEITKKELCTIPAKYLSSSLGYASNFIRFLLSLYDICQAECPTIQRLMYDYRLGCTKNGSIIFWQIDTKGRIRTGKIMQYNPDTGKRIKKESGAIDWIHSKLKHTGILSDDWELSQCLFGSHLLSKRPNDTVCLVESEKSAIIGSAEDPGYIWLATGGKGNLKADMCECLKGRDVIIYPDLGAFDDWSKKAQELARQIGFNVVVSDILEKTATDEERENGYDIADYLIQCRQNRIQKQMRTVCNPQPQQRESAPPPTREERILQSMAAVNPVLFNLINALDLVTNDGHKPRIN